jgi:hypothetical protein
MTIIQGSLSIIILLLSLDAALGSSIPAPKAMKALSVKWATLISSVQSRLLIKGGLALSYSPTPASIESFKDPEPVGHDDKSESPC